MPKINTDLDIDEFEVELPHSDSLVALNPKSVKVKITDKDYKELVSNYFNPKGSDEKAVMKIPPGLNLKN